MLYGAPALFVLVALAAPVIGLKTGMPSIKVVPSSDTSRIGYTQVQAAFGPGAPGALQLVARVADAPALEAIAEADPGIGAGGAWVAQQARNPAISGLLDPFRFLIRDHDATFTNTFDAIFATEAVPVIRTPVASAYAERVVRTIRRECLDWILICNEHRLRRVLVEYLEHYNHERPHRGRALRPPDQPPRIEAGPIERRDRLGGLIHEYHRAAA